MGVTGSNLNCLSTWWPMTDGTTLQERVHSMEQKQLTIDLTQTVLDRKYSELDVNYELLQQQVRTATYDIKNLLIRMDCIEKKQATLAQEQRDMVDNDMIILRS